MKIPGERVLIGLTFAWAGALAAFGALMDAPAGLYWVAAFIAVGGCVMGVA